MKAVTLEVPTDVLVRLGLLPDRFFDRYEEVELLETLRLEHGWRLQLVRVRRRGPLRTEVELRNESARIRRMYGLASFELVERRPRTRDYILLVRQRNPAAVGHLLKLAGGGIAPTAPFLLTAERVVASFRGEDAALRRVLQRLEREGLPFRVIRASGYPSVAEAGASRLTGAQQLVLARAWALGYFAVPRRITLSHLAHLTGRSPPALGKMLRRAEGHLVAGFLSSTPTVTDIEEPSVEGEATAHRKPRAGSSAT
jgi:predicted DNA binding protein